MPISQYPKIESGVYPGLVQHGSQLDHRDPRSINDIDPKSSTPIGVLDDASLFRSRRRRRPPRAVRMLLAVRHSARVQWLVACTFLVVVLSLQLMSLFLSEPSPSSLENKEYSKLEGLGRRRGQALSTDLLWKTQSWPGTKGPGEVSSRKHRRVLNGAATIEVVTMPYIYPDLSKIEEYRRTKTLELPDGTHAPSHTHAYIYQGPNIYPASPIRRFANRLLWWRRQQQLQQRILNVAAASISTDPQSLARAQHVLATQGDDFEKTHASPSLVLVAGLDADRYPKSYLDKVIRDRLAYARRHGYGVYIRYLQDFVPQDEREAPPDKMLSTLESAKIALMREAMYAFPSAGWLWWLDQDAVIMNHAFDFAGRVLLNKQALEQLMLRDKPIIPPTSVIHTYKRVPARQVRMLMMQNDAGVNLASFAVRNDPLYGHIIMDYLSDPLQRRYPGFRAAGTGKALNAAATHLLQWHPALLSRMALVSPKLLGAYPEDHGLVRGAAFAPGDFVYLLKSSLLANRGVLDVDFITDEWALMKGYSVAERTVEPPAPPSEAQRRMMKGD